MTTQKMVCLDLEWVLIPEIWEELGKSTNIKEFMLTTRDISDYDELMNLRINKLKENSLTLTDIKKIVDNTDPLPWAQEFMKWLRSVAQVTILTWSYYEYIMPIMSKLDYPCTFANSLIIENDIIVGYELREKDWKIEMINRFHEAWYKTIAIWDSFNDVSMLEWATHWILFKPAPKLAEQKQWIFPITNNHSELRNILEWLLSE